MIKKLPEELCTYLESLMYEVQARKDLCAFMIERGIGGESFKAYHDEYIEQNAKYELAKKEVSSILAAEGVTGNWRVDFSTGEVIVDEA